MFLGTSIPCAAHRLPHLKGRKTRIGKCKSVVTAGIKTSCVTKWEAQPKPCQNMTQKISKTQPSMPPNGSKTRPEASLGAKMRPRGPQTRQEMPKSAQEAPKRRRRRAQKGSKAAQECPKAGQVTPKSRPRGPQTPPRSNSASPKTSFSHDLCGQLCSTRSCSDVAQFSL